MSGLSLAQDSGALRHAHHQYHWDCPQGPSLRMTELLIAGLKILEHLKGQTTGHLTHTIIQYLQSGEQGGKINTACHENPKSVCMGKVKRNLHCILNWEYEALPVYHHIFF